MRNKKVVLLFNKMSDHPKKDETDVIRQMNYITKALKVLGYASYRVPFSIDIKEAMDRIRDINPYIIFNLVEIVEGTGSMIYFSPAILEHLRLSYTGVPLEPMFITSSKILTKKLMKIREIPTSDWFMTDQGNLLKKEQTYILKPIWEDGSLGLDEHCVFSSGNKKFIRNLKKLEKKNWFIETFIDGREFNLSILGGKRGPQVMPPAEILFNDYPEGKPRVVGYKAKWTEDSFEYKHTPRTFRHKAEDKPMLDELMQITLQCWNDFGLRGYARVDFRVDRQNRPYVLEINANPCISPDSGFVAATKQAGLKFPDVVKRIIEDAVN